VVPAFHKIMLNLVRDDLVLLQARRESLQRAVGVAGAAMDEERFDARMRRAERVNRDIAVHFGARRAARA
jgi:hypothetical protein